MKQIEPQFRAANEEKRTKIFLQESQIGIGGVTALGFAIESSAKFPIVEHTHKDKLEFVLMIDGFQTFVANGVNYTIYSDEMFVASANEPHAAKESENKNNILMWFQIDLIPFDGFLNQYGSHLQRVFDKLTSFKGRKFKLEHELTERFTEAFYLIKSPNLMNKAKGQALFVYCILSVLEIKPTLKVMSDDIDYAKQYILSHVQEAIDLDELMIKSDLNPVEFKKKFKEQIGYSPHEFINYAKIQNVKDRVAQTNESISDIAYDYNFSTVRYFKLLFKRYHGCSPAKYRRKHRHEFGKSSV